jgi:hypothetical protein
MNDKLMIFLLACLPASAAVIGDISQSARPGSDLTVQAILIGIICIVVGLFFCFSGLKLFRTACYIAGFLFFSNLASILVQRFDSQNSITDTFLLIICIVVGIIGGFVAQAFWQLGVALIGAVGGIAAAVTLLSLNIGTAIDSDWGRIVFIVVFSIVGAVLILMFERPVLIGATAVSGATVAIFGLDVYVKTGYADALISFLQEIAGGDSPTTNFTGGVAAMAIAVVVLSIAGAYYQYNSVGQNRKYR